MTFKCHHFSLYCCCCTEEIIPCNFLIFSQGLGKCLEDAPTETEYTYPDLPPGAMYNADLQCRLQFNTTDEDIKMCSQLDEICSQLWCMINGTCTTLLRPAAPGTRCGKHKVNWCRFYVFFEHEFSWHSQHDFNNIDFLCILSGVKISIAWMLKTCQRPSKEDGEIGRNGVRALVHVALEFPFRQGLVTIQLQLMAVNFASEKELVTRLVTLSHVHRTSQASEHNNAPKRTAFQLRINTIHGFRTFTPMIHANYTVQTKRTHSFRHSRQLRTVRLVELELMTCVFLESAR